MRFVFLFSCSSPSTFFFSVFVFVLFCVHGHFPFELFIYRSFKMTLKIEAPFMRKCDELTYYYNSTVSRRRSYMLYA